jgi:hypothetical protein
MNEKDLRDVKGQSYAAGWRDGYRVALQLRGIRVDTREAIRRDVAEFVRVQQERREGSDGGGT